MRLIHSFLLFAAWACPPVYPLVRFRDLERGERVMLSPGGHTACLDGRPYKFQVDVQDLDKLIIFFAGGGVCWDVLSDDNNICPKAAHVAETHGMMLRNTILGPKFKDFTLVVVSYCSGDLHLGMAENVLENGKVLKHYGILNFRAVLNWLATQQKTSELANPLSELVILGSSAGCYPAMLLSNQIIKSIQSERSVVFIDSMELILPRGVLSKLFNIFGTCAIFKHLVSAQALALCKDRNFEVKDLFVELAELTPHIPYVFLVGKSDHIQRKFFNALMRASYETRDKLQMQEEIDRYFSMIGEFSQKLPNVVAYFVNGESHVFTNRGHYFTADATGASGNVSFRGPKLKAWIERLPLFPGEKIRSVCDGEMVTKIPLRGNYSIEEDLTYCYAPATEKAFMQPAHLLSIRTA